jgi:hypothetical protein
MPRIKRKVKMMRCGMIAVYASAMADKPRP